MIDLDSLRNRINELLAIESDQSMAIQTELCSSTLSVMRALYGSDSIQERNLLETVDAIGGKEPNKGYKILDAIKAIKGVLRSMKSEIESGFVGSLRATISGEVLADLIKLARTTLGESSDDAKNVACVLAAAAFEDTLRKLADLRGIPASDKLADVLIALKEAGLLRGAQVGIAQSYLGFRNKALHAKWAEVDRASAESVLSFTERLLTSEFK